ncbi:MAG: hypothetical protein Q9178_007250 [Gyalolechia marmorata]
MEIQAPRVTAEECFEDNLGRVHDSLVRRITEYHKVVERVLVEKSPYIQAESPQVSSSSSALITALWSLLEPKGQKTLGEFREDPVGEVEQRLSVLEEQLKKLTHERMEFVDEISSCNNRLARSRRELSEANATTQRLAEQNSKYRSIILEGSSGDAGVPDGEICRLFVELRDLIQRIVHRHFSDLGQRKTKINNNPGFEDQQQFRDALEVVPTESLRKFLLRAKLFDFINIRLISAPTFGIGAFEKGLMTFERALHSSAVVSHAELAEWRSRTIDCGTWLEERSHLPRETYREILDFMDPFVAGATVGSAAGRDQLGKLMGELCNKAYDLSVLMRRSKKATFQVSRCNDETIITPTIEARVNCQTFDGPSQPEILGSRIAMTIFGGLLKVPENSAEDRVMILEKSHVDFEKGPTVTKHLVATVAAAWPTRRMQLKEKKRELKALYYGV